MANSKYNSGSQIAAKMMNLSKSLLALAVITASSWPHVVEAVEASPFPFTVTQPDGSQVTLFVRGNEYVNFFADPSGFPVVKSILDDNDDTVHIGADNSAFVYATLNSDGSLSSTEHQVGRVDPTRVPGLVPYVAPSVNVDEHFLAADQSEVTALPGVTGTRNDLLNNVPALRFPSYMTSVHTGRTLQCSDIVECPSLQRFWETARLHAIEKAPDVYKRDREELGPHDSME
jgi:hypothetical protein